MNDFRESAMSAYSLIASFDLRLPAILLAVSHHVERE